MFDGKNLAILGMVVASIVAVLTIMDMAVGLPFGNAMVFDIIYLISAALVLYLGFDAYSELV